MNIYEFLSGVPWLSFFVAYMLIELVRRSYKLTIRHLNIRKAGWPPEHLDADGDFKPAPKVES